MANVVKDRRSKFSEDVDAEGGEGEAEVMAVNKELKSVNNKTPPRARQGERIGGGGQKKGVRKG